MLIGKTSFLKRNLMPQNFFDDYGKKILDRGCGYFDWQNEQVIFLHPSGDWCERGMWVSLHG
jgi:hypothetical protein